MRAFLFNNLESYSADDVSSNLPIFCQHLKTYWVAHKTGHFVLRTVTSEVLMIKIDVISFLT